MSIKTLNIDLFPDNVDGIQISRTLSSVRYKGSKSAKVRQPEQPSLSDEGRKWEDRTYGVYERMISGGGLTGLEGKQLDELIASTNKGFLAAGRDLESNLSRTVKGGDTRVKEAARGMLTDSQNTAIADAKTAHKTGLAEDAELGLDQGMDALSNAKRMAASITQQYNSYAQQYNQSQQQYGTFGSQLGQGLGSMGGWLTAAQRYGQGMSGGSTQTPASIPIAAVGGIGNAANIVSNQWM